MPVSTGRVSSRDAARATLRTVSTSAGPGTSSRSSPSGSGSGGKSSRRRVRMWNVAEPEVSSTSCSAARSSSVSSSAGSERTTSTRSRAGQDDGALADDLSFERHAQPDLHVGGAELDRAVLRLDLHAGERLHGAAGGGGTGDGLQLGEQRVAPGRELHVMDRLGFTMAMRRKEDSWSSGLWMVCTARGNRAARRLGRAQAAVDEPRSVSGAPDLTARPGGPR